MTKLNAIHLFLSYNTIVLFIGSSIPQTTASSTERSITPMTVEEQMADRI